jgi:hypothetical protein
LPKARPGICALSTALIAVALAACGGNSEPAEPSEPPAQLLARAAAHPAESAVATIQADLSLDGNSLLAGDSSLDLHGPYRLDPGGLPSFDFDLDAEVAGFGIDGSVVSTGDDAFVVFFGENYRLGAKRYATLERGLKAAREEGGPPSLSLDPVTWFEDPRYAGAEDVAGTECERIDGKLNARAAQRDLTGLLAGLGASSGLRTAVRPAGAGSVSAWVAFDGDTIRRISLEAPIQVQSARIGGAGDPRWVLGQLTLDAQISSVGTDAAIEPPPGGGFQPIERLIERIDDLAGLAL